MGLPHLRSDWIMASAPEATGIGLRGKLLWHTEREAVRAEEIYDSEEAPGESTVRIFRMILRPDQTAGVASWGGITAGYREILEDSVTMFEVRLKGSPTARLRFDFGMVSEDIDGDGIYDNEDTDLNRVVTEEEDVGLDGLADEDEPGYDPMSNPDPNNDNWYFQGEGKCPLPYPGCDPVNWDNDSVYYEWLNGTEGNIVDVAVFGKPDAERTGTAVVFSNDYYSYEIDLSSDRFLVPNSERNGWKTYRIPFRDDTAWTEVIGYPSDIARLTNVRVWLLAEPNQTAPDTVRIADWLFVGHENGSFPDDGPDTTYIRDYEYAENRVFDLLLDDEFSVGDSVTEVVLFREPSHSGSQDYIIANLSVKPDSSLEYASESLNNVEVELIDQDEYEVFSRSVSGAVPYVRFIQGQSDARAIGAFLVVARADQSIDTIGSVAQEPLHLKLIKHNDPEPTFKTWSLMWRNCYAIPRGLAVSEIEVDLFKGPAGSEGNSGDLDFQSYGGEDMSYLRILGLDQYNQTDELIPDGRLDDRLEIYRPEIGLIIFPEREPFNTSTTFPAGDGTESQELMQKAPQIYSYSSMAERVNGSVYYMRLIVDTE